MNKVKYRFSKDANGLKTLLIFKIDSLYKFKKIESAIKCKAIRITKENYLQALRFNKAGLVDEFRKMINDGEIGIFAQCENKIVGHIWAKLRVGNNISGNKYIRIKPNESILHSLRINKDYRKNKISFFLYAEILAVLFIDKKIDRVFVDIDDTNNKGKKALEEIGFELFSKAHIVELFGVIIFKRIISFLH